MKILLLSVCWYIYIFASEIKNIENKSVQEIYFIRILLYFR